MRRRTLLKTGSLALAGWGLTGCAPRGVQTTAASRLVMPKPLPAELARVKASWERVIRTTVGLRPHRDSGFVLKAEKFDEKVVVHNYGHGGAGMSLAWGTGAMGADMALASSSRRAAVLGCGSPGLTAARQLQRRGFDVTIYAMSIPPNTTSNMSMAGFTPTASLVEGERRTPQWDAQFREAAEISYRQLQLMVGQGYGVYWMDSYNATDNPDPQPQNQPPQPNSIADLVPEHLRPQRHREILGPGEHPFPTKYAVRTPALSIEPNLYLEMLVRDFVFFGGKIVIRKFDTPRDLMSLTESVIVNSTGLGSLTLFKDEELVPIKGQLTVIVPQAEVDYRVSSRLADGTQVSMNPRSDGIVLGNLQARGNWSLEPEVDVRQRVVDASVEFFATMRDSGMRLAASRRPAGTLASKRMPAEVPGVEAFFGLES